MALLLGWVALTSGIEGRTAAAALAGVVLMLALFACVVLHEFGHALTARRFGFATRDITLLPIGGVARLDRMPEEPWQELLVALAGPAVNLVLALLLFGWLKLSGDWRPLDGVSVTRGAFLEQLMAANVALLVFNLLPAFPMDGGRVLRALLAMRLGFVEATRRAATIGQSIAFLLGLLGLFTNPFLVFIAFFVWIGAAQESGAVQAKSALAGVTVRDAMMTRLQTLTPASTLGDAVDLLLGDSQQDFPVLQRGEVMGMLTRARLIEALAERGRDAAVAPVMEDCPIASPDEPLEQVLGRLHAGRVKTATVIDDKSLVGLLTLDNVGELLMVRAAERGTVAPRIN